MNNLDKYFNSYKEGVKNVPFDKKEIEMKFFSKNNSRIYIPFIIGLIGLFSSVNYLFFNNSETQRKSSFIVNNEVVKKEAKKEKITPKNEDNIASNKIITNHKPIETELVESKSKSLKTIKEKEKFITFRDENKLIKSPFNKVFKPEVKTFTFNSLDKIDNYSDPDELLLNKSSNSTIAGVIISVIDEIEAERMQLIFKNETLNFKFLAKDILAKHSYNFNEKYKNYSKTQALYKSNYPLSLDSFEILQDVYVELDLLDKLNPMRQLPDSLDFIEYTEGYKQIKLINNKSLEKFKSEVPIPYLIAFKMNNFDFEHQIFNRKFQGINYKVAGIEGNLQLIPIVIKIKESKYFNSIVAWYPITKQLAKALPERYKKILEYELEVLENNSKELCEKIPEQNFLGVCSNNLKNIEIENIFINSDNTELNLNLITDLRINIKAFDMMGKEVGTYMNQQIPKGNFNKRLNLNGLSKGIYILELASDKGDYLTKRFITN